MSLGLGPGARHRGWCWWGLSASSLLSASPAVIHSFIQASLYVSCDMIQVWTKSLQLLVSEVKRAACVRQGCVSLMSSPGQGHKTSDAVLLNSSITVRCVPFYEDTIFYSLKALKDSLSMFHKHHIHESWIYSFPVYHWFVLHVCTISPNMHHTSCCMFLLPGLASAACFLQRVHVEKCSGKRFPEPKKCGAQRCGWSGPLLSAVVLLAVGVMWCIDKTGPVQQPVCFCFVPSVGFWPLSSEDVRPTPGPNKIPVLTFLRFTFPQKVCFDTAYKYNKWFLKKCKF